MAANPIDNPRRFFRLLTFAMLRLFSLCHGRGRPHGIPNSCWLRQIQGKTGR